MRNAAVITVRPKYRKMTADQAREWITSLVAGALNTWVNSESELWQRKDVNPIFASPVSALRCTRCSQHSCSHELQRNQQLAETVVGNEASTVRLNAGGLVLKSSGFKVEADGSTSFAMEVVGDDEGHYGDFVVLANTLIRDCQLDDFHSRPA